MNEIEALKNAANDLELFVHEKHTTDKRKTVKMYFLTQNGATISPTLDYNQMNHFLLGFRKAINLQTR